MLAHEESFALSEQVGVQGCFSAVDWSRNNQVIEKS
jgi:hypothetical protein